MSTVEYETALRFSFETRSPRPGSGTRAAAEQILGKAGVNSESATLLPFGGTAAVEAMNDGKVDAVWIFGAPDSTSVHSFLHNPNVRIMGFQTAEALTRIFPELARLVLPQGIVDIYRNIPPNDVPLIGTTTKVLVRSHLHPEIVQLLLQTMVEAHSGPNIFQRAGEFPNGTDIEYPVAPAAIAAVPLMTISKLRLPGNENIGDARKLIASQPDALAVLIADIISSGSFTLKIESSTPRDRAPCCSASLWNVGVIRPSATAAFGAPPESPRSRYLGVCHQVPARAG